MATRRYLEYTAVAMAHFTKVYRRSILFAILISLFLSGCCDKQEVPAMIDRLYSAKAKDRNDAALDLAGCGSHAEKAVPRLIELMYDQNIGVQSAAAYALRKIDSPEARAALERATAAKKNR